MAKPDGAARISGTTRATAELPRFETFDPRERGPAGDGRGPDNGLVPRLVPPVIPRGRMRDRPQPVLPAPDRLSLRPWLPSDAATVVTAYRDPAIQFWHRRQLRTEAEARELIAAWHRQWQAETGAAWAVVRGDPGEALGRVSLRDVDLDTGQAEVGYWVLPAARGGGIAASAVTGLSRWALGELGLHRLELMHSVANPASCRVAARAGFRLEGVMVSALLHADGWHDMHLHARVGGAGSGAGDGDRGGEHAVGADRPLRAGQRERPAQPDVGG